MHIAEKLKDFELFDSQTDQQDFLVRVNSYHALFKSQKTLCSWCIEWFDVLTVLFFF